MQCQGKLKKRHFVTLTRIVSTKTSQTVFLYCTVGSTYNVDSTYPLQQRFNIATSKLVSHIVPANHVLVQLAPLHLVTVDSCAASGTPAVDLLQCPQGSATAETSCDPSEKVEWR